MIRFKTLLFSLFAVLSALTAQTKVVKLKFVETSDVHGNYFPCNFIEKKTWEGSLARVCAFVEKKREHYGDNLILIDNGDILQGQPTVYYYNFIDTVSTHITADIMNFMGYNVGNMGNHDVETGHAVYDRWIKECDFPVLGANVISVADSTNYLKPYEVLIREGVKIVVLGMITPAVPTWLPEHLWSGLRFEDMEDTARKWMEIIHQKEQPDVVVGVFHSGKYPQLVAGKYKENASVEVAKNIPGFDIVFLGHDHLKDCRKILNIAGDSVLIADPGSNALVVSDVDVQLTLEKGKVIRKKVSGGLSNVDEYGVSQAFMEKFKPQYEVISDFVSKKIGVFEESIGVKSAYFGPSAFIDFIHTMQLNLTEADVSFTAPLSYNVEIQQGDVTVSDMFNLYKYENMLYVMMLSGEEIKGFLEESYSIWTNQMKSPEDHLLLLKQNNKDGKIEYSFKNYSFNFDSAAGIIYTVDVTKPKGEKITVVSMADGSSFDKNRRYKVALNSYRGNGGGELLTKGAGIPLDQLKERIVFATEKDLRYFLMNYIEEMGTITPTTLNQWRFIPEDWVKKASDRDFKLLFGE